MIVRFIVGVLFLILAIVSGSLLFGIYNNNRSLPQDSGEIKVEGLKHAISISRDSFDIPHIEAETDEDAYYALGFVHAQERMSQMDMTRRIGQGRLSELLGERTLLLDKWSHTFGFKRIAEEMWQASSPSTKKDLTAYANGVNAYIKSHIGKFGFEFDALHYEPDLWKPQDCLIIGRLLSWEMNFSYWTDAAFSDIALKLDPERLHALMPNYDGPTVLEGNVASRPSFYTAPKIDTSIHDSLKTQPTSDSDTSHRTSLSHESKFDLAGLLGINLGAGGGSNSFVISPKRTTSGGAMLESDIHLALSSPARFHFAHIKSKEGLNVAGFCVPGLPIFVSGRNENLSWGVTNGMTDETDYFTLTPEANGYRTPSGVKQFRMIVENIIVKSDNVDEPKRVIPFTIKLSEYGPIVNDISTFELGKFFLNNSKRVVAPRSETVLGKNEVVACMWNGSKVTGDEIGCFFALHKASNAMDHSMMNSFATPCLNLCLADKKGNISFQMIGRLPRRTGDEERVLLARKADEPNDAWMEDLTTATLPSLSNPEEGFIVSANNPSTVTRTFPHSNNWEPSGRSERLRQLLKFYPKVDLARIKQIMTDVTSPFEKNILCGNILRVMRAKHNDSTVTHNKVTEEALEYLENWDGLQSETDVPTTICNMFLLRLCVDALSDELGPELFNEYLYINNVPVRTMSNMLRDENNILWDDIRSPQRETRDTIIRWAFMDAMRELTKMLGNDTRGWNWGKLHSLTYKHPFSREAEIVGKKADIKSGYAAGGLTTVVQTSYSFWKPFEQRVGPSMRMVADMKTNILYAALPTGNSGNIFSPHYGDMAALFKRGELIPVSLVSHNDSWKTLKLIPKE